jgi:epoxyqueuosine reductase
MTFPYSSRPRSRPQNTDTDASKAYGQIARYAWGSADYHDLIHPRLEALKRTIREACPQARSRGVVDTAPLMEREFAQLAGLGWAGKNSLLLNKQRGSYFFLACLLTTLELPASAAASAHCGTCTRCLDACPTDAFPAPGVVDSRRCISYLTIEHRGPIPIELRAGIGDWLFGCDICQEVCPWNAKAQRVTDTDRGVATELVSRPASDPVDLADILALDETAFRARFRDTPLWRPRRRGILRNAAICAANARDTSAVPALIALLDDPDPLIRGAAAWALGQIGNQQTPLENRLRVEDDPQVRDELTMALGHVPPADR